MIRHVSGIAEVVVDVEAAAVFYESLGLEVDRMMADYALVKVDGVLHFGLWARAHAAESTYGSRDLAERVPLGFTLGLEVDSVDGGASAVNATMVRGAQDEPWGQRTLRFTSPSGALCEITESPGQRELQTNVTPKATEVASA